MNSIDIENAKRIVAILKGRVHSNSQGMEYSHLLRIIYRDNCVSIGFGDFKQFRLRDGKICYVKEHKFITLEDVKSVVISNCLSQPRPTERLNELSTLFFNAVPIGFDNRAILVMDGKFPEGNQVKFTLRLFYEDSKGILNRIWDYDKDHVYDLRHLTRNIESYIRSIEISNMKTCIQEF